MKGLVLGLLLISATGCEDNEGRGELLAGPSVDVHCQGELPRGAIGDTTTIVNCPGTLPE